jgi:transposase-like protein
VDRLPDGGHGCACESGANDEQTTEAEPLCGLQGEGGDRGDQGERTIAQIAEQFDVHPNQVTTWKAQLEGGAADVFDGGSGSSSPAAPAVDVKQLHAKIGELTLENDFLESALTKAGLLSARR